MPRVREIKLDSLVVRIAPLSYDEAEKYITEGKEMLDRKASTEEWTKRMLASVVLSLNKATPALNMTTEKLVAEYDMLTLQEIYMEFMKMSGLRTGVPVPGEAPATSTSN